MKDNTIESIEIASRLKSLRNQAGLSHEKLKEAINEKCGEEISIDSLKKYECTSMRGNSAQANLGMSARNLLLLANFYGVSTDYILGRDQAMSTNPEIRTAVNCTGLTEKNVLLLNNPRATIGQGGDAASLDAAVRELANIVIEAIAEERLFWEYEMMKRILISLEEHQFQNHSGNTSSEINEYIRQEGLFILPKHDGTRYYAKRIGEAIERYIIEECASPIFDQAGFTIE